MIARKYYLHFSLFLVISCCTATGGKEEHSDKGASLPEENFQIAEKHYTNMLKQIDDPTQVPRTTDKHGNLKTTGIEAWTSGFFAGSLWYLYEFTDNDLWKREATKWTQALAPVQFITSNHDVGFMINCSFGNGLRLAENEAYKAVLIQAAESLITRYNANVGSIESWNYRKAWDGETEWFFPVIIDNMMNLELLFVATKLSGNPKYKEIAIKHAETTMKNHYRPDFSSYHVVDYDTISGAVLDKATCQGYTDESAWARGQAWGLYGFTVVFRETKDPKFLDFAQHIADYIVSYPTMPADKIPLWDFNALDADHHPEWEVDKSLYSLKERDVSAAAIIASALYELSTFSNVKGVTYKTFADKIIESLSSPGYRAQVGQNNNFILTQSVGSIPHKVEISVPLNYADYYFLEGLLRKKNLEL
ncbi:glycoside hydrolase family 88 protein [Fulvivirgaceae bacterium BMA12]|uniref:Glycoside hydrolase family 88 protein n=1 Tax=Agaribacillus aureus TaxID=3051825 RepID=A0ABT8L6K2_9BACT|nr:glycoside hydrolase family 88 protein [Fulvivirgaceae bacterium BMA12]